MLILLGIVPRMHAQCGQYDDNYCDRNRTVICENSGASGCIYSMISPENYDTNILDNIPNCTNAGLSFNLQNPSWFSFVAGSSSFNVRVNTFFGCQSGTNGATGFQYAIVRDCEALEVVLCNSDANGVNGAQTNISANGLIPGFTYFLIIDGFSGSVCQFEFGSITGLGNVDIDNIADIRIDGFEGSEICAGANQVELTLVDNNDNPLRFVNYTDVEIIEIASGSMIFSERVSGNSFIYDFNLTPGNYEIRAAASNDCSSSPVQFVKSISVIESENEVLSTFTFCESDFGQITLIPNDPAYLGPPINDISVDTFRYEIFGTDGCNYFQLVPLNPIMENELTVVDTTFCGPSPISYGGNNYVESGSNLLLRFTDQNGCDSMVDLTLAILEIEGSLSQSSCPDGSVTINFNENFSTPTEFLSSVDYQWRDASGAILTDGDADDQSLSTQNSGRVFLDIVQSRNGVSCTTTLETEISTTSVDLNFRCGNTTENSIQVLWDLIPDIDEYILSIGADTIARQSNGSFTISDLAIGEDITVSLIARSNDGCQDIPGGMIDCSAQNCPNVLLVVDKGDQQICLDGSISNIDFNVNVSNSVNGNGIWESTGFIDPITGVFDVVSSGEGSFSVFYSHTENGICNYTSNVVTVENVESKTVALELSTESCLGQPVIASIANFDPSLSYDWIISDGGVIQNSNGSEIEILWDSPGSKTVQLLLLQDICSTVEATNSIVILDELDIVNLNCMASESSISFDWNDINNVSQYKVVLDGDTISTQVENTFVFDNLTFGDARELEIVAIHESGCASQSSNLRSCSISNCPNVQLNINENNLNICLGSGTTNAQFTATVSTNETGQGVWSSNGIINSDTGLFDATASGVGTYYVEYSFTMSMGNCNYQSDRAMIEVFESPVADFNIPTQTCVNSSLSLDLVGFDPNFDYEVTAENGVVVLNTDNSYNIEWSEEGNYNVTLVTTSNDCGQDQMSQMVTVDGLEEPLSINCFPELDEISFNWTAVDCAESYDIMINGVFIQNQTDINYTTTSIAADETIDFEVNAVGAECVCGIPNDVVQCALSMCPNVTIELGDIGEVCRADGAFKIDLDLNDLGLDGTGTWSNALVDEEGNFDLINAPLGMQFVKYEYNFESCNYSDSISFEIFETPQFELNILPSECNQKETFVSLMSEDGNDNVDLFIDGMLSSIKDSIPLEPGEYEIEIMNKTTLCSATEMLTIEEPMSVINGTLDLIGATQLFPGQATFISAVTDVPFAEIDSVNWFYNDTLRCSDLACYEELVFTPTSSGELCLTMYFSGSCLVSDCLNILIGDEPDTTQQILDLYIPNVFYVNSTIPENRVFRVFPNPEAEFELLNMWIYDRWGSTIFDSDENPTEDGTIYWDGKKQNSVIPESGVFLYKIRYNDAGSLEYKFGSITLLK